jgi:hypothetical protein
MSLRTTGMSDAALASHRAGADDRGLEDEHVVGTLRDLGKERAGG